MTRRSAGMRRFDRGGDDSVHFNLKLPAEAKKELALLAVELDVSMGDLILATLLRAYPGRFRGKLVDSLRTRVGP